MSRGRKVTRAEAAELLAEWESSGEKMSVWCKARGINWYSLNGFKGAVELCVTPDDFAEVVLAAPPPEAVGRYRVEIGGIVVEVDDHFRDDTLRRLVQVVASC